ncbi:MAG: STAS domain-containing protein [Peptococcales bacterium]|jgi:anti-sigma B factor antagonist
MSIKIENSNGFVKFAIDGSFSMEEAGVFKEEAYQLLQNGKSKFLVDFSNCNFIDSTGLGMLVAIYKKCAEQGGELSLCSINDTNVLKVFQLTRLDKVFEI